jgi:hypothetical protein
MTNWKEELNKKQIELNIKKEVANDVRIETDSSLRDRSDSGRRGNVDLPDLRKKELKNLTKGGRIMIPSKGLFDDYNAIDKEEIGTAEKVWKMIPKLIKIILNCRTNSVKIMDKLGVPRDEVKKETPKE